MKSNIDLTENRDFDPSNFKVDRVKSRYYDDNTSSRTPWDKSGKLLTGHKIDYWSSIDNFGWTTSWSDGEMTITPRHFMSILEEGIIQDPLGDFWYDPYSGITSTSINDHVGLRKLQKYLNYQEDNVKNPNGLKLGKVSDIRTDNFYEDNGIIGPFYKIKSSKRICRSFKNYYSDEENYYDAIHDNYNSYKRARKYEGYNPYEYSMSVKEYRAIDKKDLPWYDVVYNEFKYRNTMRKPKNLIKDKKVNWYDNHTDYIRRTMGLRSWRS